MLEETQIDSQAAVGHDIGPRFAVEQQIVCEVCALWQRTLCAIEWDIRVHAQLHCRLAVAANEEAHCIADIDEWHGEYHCLPLAIKVRIVEQIHRHLMRLRIHVFEYANRAIECALPSNNVQVAEINNQFLFMRQDVYLQN